MTAEQLQDALGLEGIIALAYKFLPFFSLNLGWIIPALIGLVLGLICAVQGFRDSLKAMELMSSSKKKQDPPPVSFNHHD